MIDLEKKNLEIVLSILNKEIPDCRVDAFGSRAIGKARKYSDLDLVIIRENEIPEEKLEALKDAFSESELPIMVDIVDWQKIPDNFREIIRNNSIPLQKAGNQL